jgi:hypothetical protein
VRYAIVAITVVALLAAGVASEWRGPSSTGVPAIELRPPRADEQRLKTAPKAAQKREQSSEMSGGAGATPAGAQVPARAGEHDEGDDDSWEDDGDDSGD